MCVNTWSKLMALPVVGGGELWKLFGGHGITGRQALRAISQPIRTLCFLVCGYVRKQSHTPQQRQDMVPQLCPPYLNCRARIILPLWKQWETASICHLLSPTSALPGLPTGTPASPITSNNFRPFLYAALHCGGGDSGKGGADDSLPRTSTAAGVPIPHPEEKHMRPKAEEKVHQIWQGHMMSYRWRICRDDRINVSRELDI